MNKNQLLVIASALAGKRIRDIELLDDRMSFDDFIKAIGATEVEPSNDIHGFMYALGAGPEVLYYSTNASKLLAHPTWRVGSNELINPIAYQAPIMFRMPKLSLANQALLLEAVGGIKTSSFNGKVINGVISGTDGKPWLFE